MSSQRLRGLRRWAMLLPMLVWFASCPLSSFPFLPHTASPEPGTLLIDIDYTGIWYRETAGYARKAENFMHYVLVVPEDEMTRASAATIFVNLGFPTDPYEPFFRPNAYGEVDWALDYLYAAPEGLFRGEFAPGTYAVAVAFILAARGSEGTWYADDGTFIYTDVVGGGASTDYQMVEIAAEETIDLTIGLVDTNGWACPWLYVDNGYGFECRTEILRNVRGAQQERAEETDIGTVRPVDGSIVLRLSEERAEITYLDEFYIVVEGTRIDAADGSDSVSAIAAVDYDYLVLSEGETATFSFRLPAALADRERVAVRVVATGYYEPLSDS